MANEVSSATNLEDLFTKIVSFLTTNATLVAASQNWTVMRQRRDNIASMVSDLPENITPAYARMIQTCRYETRTLNSDGIAGLQSSYTSGTTAVMGTSYVKWQLKSAKTIAKVVLRCNYNSHLSTMPKSFRLQSSDDGTTWTTALTVTNTASYTLGELREFTVTGAGSHVYWKIIFDAAQSGTNTISWSTLLLLEADGTVANHFGSEVILKAPDLSGTGAIYTGIRTEYEPTSGWYNLFLNGYSGYDANEKSWLLQPGALPGDGAATQYKTPMVPCWNDVMPYWFSASGRSFRFAVKVSTYYEGGYLGFIKTYVIGGQNPYPLAIGGSLTSETTTRGVNWKYSHVSARRGAPAGPGGDFTSSAEPTGVVGSTLLLRAEDGSWKPYNNRGTSSWASSADGVSGPTFNSIPPVPSGAIRSVWPHCMQDFISAGKRPYRECLGGGYLPHPCILLQRVPTLGVLGELDCVYNISGYSNASENTTTIGGKTAVIFQNTYRNSIHEYWALVLE